MMCIFGEFWIYWNGNFYLKKKNFDWKFAWECLNDSIWGDVREGILYANLIKINNWIWSLFYISKRGCSLSIFKHLDQAHSQIFFGVWKFLKVGTPVQNDFPTKPYKIRNFWRSSGCLLGQRITKKIFKCLKKFLYLEFLGSSNFFRSIKARKIPTHSFLEPYY